MGIGGDGEPRRPHHARVGNVVEGGHGHMVRQAEGPPGFFPFVPGVVSFRRRRQRCVSHGTSFAGFRLRILLLRGACAGLHHGRRPQSAHLLRQFKPPHGLLDLLRTEPGILHGFPVFFDLPEVVLSKDDLIKSKGGKELVLRRFFSAFRSARLFTPVSETGHLSRGKAVDMADPRPYLLPKAHSSAVRRGRTYRLPPQNTRQNQDRRNPFCRSSHALRRLSRRLPDRPCFPPAPLR
ncbi:hypothetical protein SDC9_43490 [bioreactor metagenome]|uniref:Uncharacterized protein n=1 Tax=bioreactor metagenome TaxID=1076179 RepID=A0A644W0T4_9ZZZZ